jgi:hypothetical protein
VRTAAYVEGWNSATNNPYEGYSWENADVGSLFDNNVTNGVGLATYYMFRCTLDFGNDKRKLVGLKIRFTGYDWDYGGTILLSTLRVEASQDNTTWTLVQSVTNYADGTLTGHSDTQKNGEGFSAPGYYRYYRIDIPPNSNVYGSYTIHEIDLYEETLT